MDSYKGLILKTPVPFNGTTNKAINNPQPINAKAPTSYNPNYLNPFPVTNPWLIDKTPTKSVPNNPGP